MDFIGYHCIITIKNIKNSIILEKKEFIKPLLDIIIKECDLHVVNEAGHQFEPIGVTYVYVLSESHLSIHTYPETSTAYMDIFCCNKNFSAENAISVIKKLFKTDDIEYSLLIR